MRNCFGKHICGHSVSRAMDHLEDAILYGLPNEMVLYVDMFCMCMVVLIYGQTLSHFIVAIYSKVMSSWSEGNNSAVIFRSQKASFAAWVAATYSASVVEAVTKLCFFELQLIAPPSSRNA